MMITKDDVLGLAVMGLVWLIMLIGLMIILKE